MRTVPGRSSQGLLFGAVVPSVAGDVELLWTDRGVVAVGSWGPGEPAAGKGELFPGMAWGQMAQVATPPQVVSEALLSGRAAPDLVDERIFRLPFQTAVLRLVGTIPSGTTMTYGEVAAAVGHPGAARAVGTVMAGNPVPLLIPCHRVVPAGGGAGHFSFGRGRIVKEELLAKEKATVR